MAGIIEVRVAWTKWWIGEVATRVPVNTILNMLWALDLRLWSLEAAVQCSGAGKTFTMEGTQENPGINYRTMKELFRYDPVLQ